MSFSPERLRHRLQSLGAGDAGRLVVAFSGGLDSTVLLHALSAAGFRAPISAIHVNHGLQREAARWQAHCETACEALGIELDVVSVSVDDSDGKGPEAAAREARYEAFTERLRDGDVLLSAHHLDDQAETLLLNLLRASGPLGLSGIPASRPLGAGRLVRPLLDISRDELLAWAESQKLDWIVDPSNAQTGYDRNFLRHEVLPRLDERWPGAASRLARSADLLGESSQLLDELAAIDLADHAPGRLPIGLLSSLAGARARNLLRYATRLIGLPLPPSTALERILSELVTARDDAQPLVQWRGAEARRYRDALFLLPPLPASPVGEQKILPGETVELGSLGRLRAESAAQPGLSPDVAGKGLRIAFREGGEVLQPAGSDCSRPLKKLLQEAFVLPWMRERIPLLYSGDRLVAVADLWVDQSVLARPGIAIRWENRPDIT